MERKIKMVGLDLDGTLLDETKTLRPYTRKVLEEAISRGVVVLVATGRPWLGIPEELREFPGMDYALTSNGARILDVKNDRILEEHLLMPEEGKKALEVCAKYDTLKEIYFDGQGYADEDKLARAGDYHRNPHMCDYIRKTRIPEKDLMGLLERENRGMDKVQALFANLEERQAAWEEMEKIPGLVLVGSLGYNIEVNAEGVNKGAGLVALGKILGIEREEIMACGDGDNDIAMLREVGFGVAMGNADEAVKAAADYVTEDNEAEGAAKAIERFVLKRGV